MGPRPRAIFSPQAAVLALTANPTSPRAQIYNDAGKTLENPIMCGIVDKPDGKSSLWRCEAVVRFPAATPRQFSAKARDYFRNSIAAAAGVNKLKVRHSAICLLRIRPSGFGTG